ncbi:MAG: AIR synthase, partial [Thaumarchaeota archaeon]|nr:AIR synthase [Nitrososphaerota archaeon]
KEFVTASGCRPGDRIFMTKSAGLEGTSILSELVEGASEGFEESLSVVDEAVASFSTGLVHAMHDPTEGGILGGVYEMSLASNLGFTLYEDRVPVAEKTSELCSTLGIDPLKLISSGSLLISVGREDEKEFEREMEARGFEVSCVGEFTEGPRVLKRRDGGAEVVGEVVDELWRVLSSPKLKY